MSNAIEEMANAIVSDHVNSIFSGKPRRFEFNLAKPFETLMPNGKNLGDCTGAEVELIEKAYKKAARIFKAEKRRRSADEALA